MANSFMRIISVILALPFIAVFLFLLYILFRFLSTIINKSAESEYAIEYPTIREKDADKEFNIALKKYIDGVKNLQSGNRLKGNLLNQEALEIYPDLHNHARNLLLKMISSSEITDFGPIYYWIGIHSENLNEIDESLKWYQKAIKEYKEHNLLKTEGRIHCNIGNIYIQKDNYEKAKSEFEEAVRLNKSDGIAYFNIGLMDYRICEKGDEKYLKAIDSFAHSIVAEPNVYTSIVLSTIREYSYTWKEDYNEVMQKAAILKE